MDGKSNSHNDLYTGHNLKVQPGSTTTQTKTSSPKQEWTTRLRKV